jgi:CubicO group peptidase (beta-lactamase class C family)
MTPPSHSGISENFDLVSHLKSTTKFTQQQLDSAPEFTLFGTHTPIEVSSESLILDDTLPHPTGAPNAPTNSTNPTGLDKEQITRYFEQLANHGVFSGTAALYKNGELFTIQTGYIDDRKTKKADKNSKYRFGSITKTLTAVLIMKAIEEKKISLLTPLGFFINTDKDGNVLKQATKVNIQTMLNHRSFLYNYTNDPEFSLHGLHEYNDVLKMIIKHQDEMPPADSQNGQYSNSNYYLLGKILEILEKKNLQDIFYEKFFKPFNMTDTLVLQEQTYPDSNYTNHPRNEWNEVSSFLPVSPFDWKSTPYGGYSSWETTGGTGALLTTPSDMIKFYLSVFVQKKFISLESIELMRKYRVLGDGLNYGHGIYQVSFLSPITGELHRGFGHNGVIDGFMSQISILPQRPGGDPVVDPFHIYVQSSNGFNTNLAAPIITMNNYMLGDQKIPIAIPDFIQYDDQSLYKYYRNTWNCPTLNNINVITTFDEKRLTKIKNWNNTINNWEYIDRYQMSFQIVGQAHGVSMSTAGQHGIYAYWPEQLFFQFLFNDSTSSSSSSLSPKQRPTGPATQFIINIGGNQPHYCTPIRL